MTFIADVNCHIKRPSESLATATRRNGHVTRSRSHQFALTLIDTLIHVLHPAETTGDYG